MPETPILALARRCRAALRASYEAEIAASGATADVAEVVRSEGHVSINVKPEALLAILTSGKWSNKFDLARAEAAASGRSIDEVLRESLGEHYERRTRFEETMAGTSRFHYGALSVGGLGIPHYGPYCVVLRHGLREHGNDATEPVWVGEDSLRGPWWSDTRLDEDVLGSAIAVPADGNLLAAVKLGASADPATSRGLRDVLCSDAGFVEALLTTAPIVDDIVAVRVDGAVAAAHERRVLAARRSAAAITDLPDDLIVEELGDRLDALGLSLEEVAP